MSRTEVQDPIELAEVITHSIKENTPLCQNTKETTIHVNPTTAGKEIIPAALVEESEFLAKASMMFCLITTTISWVQHLLKKR